MEWAKQAEDVFKTWADVQRNMWENWFKGIQGFGLGQSGQVWERTVDAWEESVKRTLDTQVEWTRVWAESFNTMKGTPKEMGEWARQGQDMLKRWTEIQKQLWEGWFQTVRKLQPSGFGGSWAREGQPFLQAWHDTIQKTLDAQADWTRFWAAGQAGQKTKP
jgi:hypothetical protein